MLSFYPKGSNLSLPFLYGQWLWRYRQIFNTAIFGHETWPLPKVQDSAHIFLFYPKVVKKWAYFCSTSKLSLGFRDRPNFKFAVFGHEAWSLPNIKNVARIFSFYHTRSKLSWFSFYKQRFSRYRPMSKISIFRQKGWSLIKVQKVTYVPFLSQWVEIELISLN